MPKVIKFGGTSVGSVESIHKCIVILSTAPKGSVAVFSAFSGVTDLLAQAADSALNDFGQAQNYIESINSKSRNFAIEIIKNKSSLDNALSQIETIVSELTELLESINFLKECYPTALDSVLSKGELLSSAVIYHALDGLGINSYFADARDFIVTDNNYGKAKPIFDLIETKILEYVCEKVYEHNFPIVVTQGFIGRSLDNKTSTLGRGGSDFSASIIGASLSKIGYNIESIDIYTDVNGIMTADPRLVHNAGSLKQVTVNEMLEMSYFGAKVLHPYTILPALASKLPVRVLNTFNSNFKGTAIVDSEESKETKFNSIVKLSDVYYLKIQSDSTSELINEVHKITERIISSGCLLLNSSIYSYSASIVAKIPDEILLMVLASNGTGYLKVNAIAITGENIRNSRELSAKFNVILDDYDSGEFLLNFMSPTGNSILLISDNEPDLKLIHDVFIPWQFA